MCSSDLSLFLQSNLLNEWSHIHLILPLFLPSITLGIQLTPTYSSVSVGYFCQSRYFQTIMDVAEPERPVSKGSQTLYPLPFDNLDQLSFTRFLSFFYQPRKFIGTKWDWKNIHDYCIDWYLPEHTAIATCKLIEIWYSSFTYAKRQTLRTVSLSCEMVHRQQNHWR